MLSTFRRDLRLFALTTTFFILFRATFITLRNFECILKLLKSLKCLSGRPLSGSLHRSFGPLILLCFSWWVRLCLTNKIATGCQRSFRLQIYAGHIVTYLSVFCGYHYWRRWFGGSCLDVRWCILDLSEWYSVCRCRQILVQSWGVFTCIAWALILVTLYVLVIWNKWNFTLLIDMWLCSFIIFHYIIFIDVNRV